MQGRHYRVTAFVVIPEITVYDDKGKEFRRFPAGGRQSQLTFSMLEADYPTTLPKFLEAAGFDMEGNKP
jgi:hypothetical protein